MNHVSLRNGEVCCSGDPKNFCDQCKGNAHTMVSEPAWRAYLASAVPPPVSFVAAVRQKTVTPEQRAAQFFGKPRPLAPSTRHLIVATRSAVPAPVGLVATIQQQKGKLR